MRKTSPISIDVHTCAYMNSFMTYMFVHEQFLKAYEKKTEKCRHRIITFIHSQKDEFHSIFYLESYLFSTESIIYMTYLIDIQQYINSWQYISTLQDDGAWMDPYDLAPTFRPTGFGPKLFVQSFSSNPIRFGQVRLGSVGLDEMD